MRKLTDGAARAKEVLERESAPVPAECERLIALDLGAVLNGYFELEGGVDLQIERGEQLRITVRARARRARPFNVARS